ncbi:MAG: winged helix-turn-helix domain-containing protein [Calditerricola sp.]|nr:winged helix-turn-helix domain-containing protein [Calditerricola sp.]
MNVFITRGGWKINERQNGGVLPSGETLIKIFDALSHPHRLKILSLLIGRRVHVSQLAREAKISRPLLYMHLKRLENAGLVRSKMELSTDGKALNYYEIIPFSFHLTPENLAEAGKTLSVSHPQHESGRTKRRKSEGEDEQ